jgi:hypothetical protein
MKERRMIKAASIRANMVMGNIKERSFTQFLNNPLIVEDHVIGPGSPRS